MHWRRWNYALHRDLGYLCAGLPLLYALSGIAVNHLEDWNPNYLIERRSAQIPPRPSGLFDTQGIPLILQQLGESRMAQSSFQPDPDNLWLYVDQRMIRIHLPSGRVEHEVVKRRPFWYPLNFLHLNHAKKAWTWVADIYAGALLLVAVTGLLMAWKKSGLQKRGVVLGLAGLLIPLLFLFLYY